MAQLHWYGEPIRLAFDDRTLAHLQVVIIKKLRSRESFAFSWTEPVSTGGGRNTVWLHPGCQIAFRFDGSRRPTINRAWVDELALIASTPSGLHLVPEPREARRA